MVWTNQKAAGGKVLLDTYSISTRSLLDQNSLSYPPEGSALSLYSTHTRFTHNDGVMRAMQAIMVGSVRSLNNLGFASSIRNLVERVFFSPIRALRQHSCDTLFFAEMELAVMSGNCRIKQGGSTVVVMLISLSSVTQLKPTHSDPVLTLQLTLTQLLSSDELSRSTVAGGDFLHLDPAKPLPYHCPTFSVVLMIGQSSFASGGCVWNLIWWGVFASDNGCFRLTKPGSNRNGKWNCGLLQRAPINGRR